MSTSVDQVVPVAALGALAAVAVGGAAGASVRYIVETWAVSRWGQSWPWGTFAVNIIGSLILGIALGGVLASELPRWASLLLATGFCGALTTFSSFALQVVDLSRARTVLTAASSGETRQFSLRGVAYAATSLGAGLLAAVSIPALIGGVGL